MGSVNKVTLLGRVGKDPEVRVMQNGGQVATFSLATSESWKDKNSGERKEKTQWSNIVIFNEHIVKVVESYVRKGSQVYLEGALETRTYEKDGKTNYVTEVVLKAFRGELVLLDSKSEDKPVMDKASVSRDDPEDEIPF